MDDLDLIDMLTSGELWPIELSDDQVSSLSRWGRYLLAMAGAGEAPQEVPDAAELEPLAGFHRGKLGKFIVSSMLCFGGNDAVVDSLAAHVLRASLREVKDGSLGVAEKACCRIRLMPQGEYPLLRAALEDFTGMETEEVFESLQHMREAIPEQDLNTKQKEALKAALDPVFHLLNRYVENRAQPASRKSDPPRHTSAVPAVAKAEIAAVDLHRFHDSIDGPRDDGGFDSARSYADAATSGTAAHRRSAAVQDYRAKAAAAQIVRGYMMSPCRWGVLFDDELERLVRQLRAGVRDRQPIDALLVASLLTGRPAEILSMMNLRQVKIGAKPRRGTVARHQHREVLVYRGKHMALRTGLQLPAPGSRKYGRYYEKAESIVYLPLPSQVLECLSRPAPPYEGWADALSERARELGTILSRIESAGHLWLYHSGYDRTLLSRLFGEDLAHATAIYYENMSRERTLLAYKAWYEHINRQIPNHPFLIRRQPRESRVGSRRTPKALVVTNLFRKYREFVSNLLDEPRDLIVAHEHYAAYTYLVLSFASGLRPVRQPFETLNDFCRQTSTYFIQDKDTVGIASPRFVQLAPFAVEQLDHYLAYLSWLPTKLGAYSRRREYIEAALYGEVPVLFSLAGDPREPRPLTPGRIEEILTLISPLVLNWPRHFQRTALIDRGVRDDVVQALLGHGDMGQEPYARYSGLTMADLKDAADHIQALAEELRIEPLPHPDGDPNRIRRGRTAQIRFDYEEQRRSNAKTRKRHRARERQRGLNWVAAKVRAIEDHVETLRDQEAADAWQKQALVDLKEKFGRKIAWLVARGALAKELDRLNEKHGLAIPVPPVPRRPWRTPLMHDQVTFRARAVVHKAAAKFLETLNDPKSILAASDESLLSLTLFSAACFGGLAEPEALLAFAHEIWNWDGRTRLLNHAPEPVNLCWVTCRYETRGAANVVVEGKTLRMRRFFLDGTTLVLLVRYLRRRRAKPAPAATKRPYGGGKTFMKRLRWALEKRCGAELPAEFTVGKLCKGAVGVAEFQPGVRLPHYLVEYAAGLITSLSLPEVYFRAYLGRTYPASTELQPQETIGRRRTRSLDSRLDPELDRAVRRVRGLFVAIPDDRSKAKKVVVERMDALLSSSPSVPTQRLVEWLKELITRQDRPLVLASARRYSDWIASGWLVQFEGVGLERLSGEEWCQRYEELIELEDEHNRPQVAGRIAHFHEFLHRTQGYEPLPDYLQLSYQSQRFVRAQAIPERVFAAFVARLPEELPDAGELENVRWIFTLCYRLGTRIGETTRIRMSDIGAGENPVIRLRATRFGNTKTKIPHQLPLNPFLPEAERRGFREWLEQRRMIARQDNALVFGKGDAPNLLWDTRDLARLFTAIMYKLTGVHFAPHGLRHSAASRLIWLAENEIPPEGRAYTREEIDVLKRTVFTAAPDCRDRIWHLSSVFNHHSPSTTFESYVHFLDLLLYRKLACSRRRLPPRALRRLLDIPRKRFSRSEFCNADGFRIEKVLPVVFEFNARLFEVVEPAPGPGVAASVAPEQPPRARQPMRHVLVQPILEDLENGQEAETVAIRFGVQVDWVKALEESASKLAAVTTSHGVSRLFSRERLKTAPYPLSPTRIYGIADQKLLSALLPQWEGERDEQRRTRMREACFHFLRHITTADSGLPFHTPESLRRFLDVFVELENEAVDRDRWLILVGQVTIRSEEAQRAAWSVHDGICVDFRTSDATGSARYSDGVAYLHLQVEGEVRRTGARQETSKAMKYVLHLLSLLLLTEDILERGEDGTRDWPLGQQA